MIHLIAEPKKLSTRWQNYIQEEHDRAFGYRMDNIHKHWWLIKLNTDGKTMGIAGCKEETDELMFLGPCVVREEFRGKGIQREFIRERELLARSLEFDEIISCTHYKNYVSSNNFIRCGFLLRRPWFTPDATDNMSLNLYWGKKLCENYREIP